MTSPTQRSLNYLRKNGCLADVVEKWIPFARIRKDLFGFVDILAIDECGNVLGIQATSRANQASRISKITAHENWPKVRASRLLIYVHGWKKMAKSRRWEVAITKVE